MCDTIVVVGPDGVLFAKNSDRDANEAQLLSWHPAADHAPGATVRCTYVEVPQARHTHAVLLSRPFWMWGAEIGANEHGVVLGNEAVFTTEPYAVEGLTGMDLLRLALERAASAEQAVEVITTLLEQHGQGGGCGHEHRSFTYHNSFIAADTSGAFVLETAGRHWVVERVERGARSISNALTIPAFADRFSDTVKTWGAGGRGRQPYTQACAAGARDEADLMRVLRSHGDGRVEPRYSPVNGGLGAPCVHAGGLAANSQTTASWVAALHPGGQRHWVTATAAPCTSLFKPVRVTEPLDLGPAPDDRFDARTLWWRHECLHRWAVRDPGDRYPLFVAERDATEARWLADPPEPADAFAEGDRLLARWLGAIGAGRDRRPPWVRRFWRVRDRRAGVPVPAAAPR